MPRITIVAVNTDSGRRRWTLSERVVADNLENDHYVHQLIERLRWATADAEDLEVGASEVDGDAQPQPATRRSVRTARSGGQGSRSGPRRSASRARV